MKRTLSLLMLGLAIHGFQEETAATQPTFLREKNGEASNSMLDEIIRKMEKNDKLSANEEQTFDQALQQINEKKKMAGGRVTALSPLEQKIYSQDRINKITPTINDILENGLMFNWGMDLKLLEERGKNLRSGNVPGGGADLSSVVTTFQKQKENSETKKKRFAQEKNEAIQKIKEITEETKAKLDALNSVNTLKRPSLKQKIQEEEKAALESLNKIIIQRNQDLKGVEEANETTITKIMAITKLDRQTVEKLPDMTTWKEMKAHPETIHKKIEPAVFARHRGVPKTKAFQEAPQVIEEEKENVNPSRPMLPVPFPPVPKRPPPPSRLQQALPPEAVED